MRCTFQVRLIFIFFGVLCLEESLLLCSHKLHCMGRRLTVLRNILLDPSSRNTLDGACSSHLIIAQLFIICMWYTGLKKFFSYNFSCLCIKYGSIRRKIGEVHRSIATENSASIDFSLFPSCFSLKMLERLYISTANACYEIYSLKQSFHRSDFTV